MSWGTQGHWRKHQKSGLQTHRCKVRHRDSFMFQNTRARGPMKIHGDSPVPRAGNRAGQWVSTAATWLESMSVNTLVSGRDESKMKLNKESEGRARLGRSRSLDPKNTALALREHEDLWRMGELCRRSWRCWGASKINPIWG